MIPASDFHGVMRLSARIVDADGTELDTDEQQVSLGTRRPVPAPNRRR